MYNATLETKSDEAEQSFDAPDAYNSLLESENDKAEPDDNAIASSALPPYNKLYKKELDTENDEKAERSSDARATSAESTAPSPSPVVTPEQEAAVDSNTRVERKQLAEILGVIGLTHCTNRVSYASTKFGCFRLLAAIQETGS